MASEMTTAEMVGTLRLAASHGRNTKPAAHSRCDELDAIANRLAALDKDATAALARAEKAEAEATKWRGLYEKATDALDGWKRADTCDPMVRGECVREARERTDAHDAARKEAGLC